MNAAQALPFQVRFECQGAQLRVHVVGDNTLANAIAYWQVIVAEVRRRAPQSVLLIDELRGPPLAPEQWKQLVDSVPRDVLAPVRIAHVKPRGLDRIEYCEIHAREAGLTARVFVSEVEAAVWLRYGER
jgi:hypothetical protein